MTAPASRLAARPAAARAGSPRRWFLDVDAMGAAAPLVVLLVVGTLRKGAFFKPDVAMLACLCLALALVSPAVLRWLTAHPVPVLAAAGVVGWWLVDATIDAHPIESWRMPATWVCAAAGYGAARALAPSARRITALAVTVFACVISVVGLALVAGRSTIWTWPDERSLRFQGPLTYPSAIGLYLVLALVASTVAWRDAERFGQRAPGIAVPLATVARSLIVLGAVATDSRGTIVALAVALCFRRIRRAVLPAAVAAALASPFLLYAQRAGVRPWLIAAAAVVAIGVSVLPESLLRKGIWLVLPALGAAGWLLATQHHTISGLDASWTERDHILRGAAALFASHPWFGAGPDASIPTTTLTGAPGIDAFAHNEPLELLVSIGVVGTLAFAAAAFLVVRALWPRRGVTALPVIATVAAAGLVDFVWHLPALGLLAGIVAGVSRRAAR